MKNYGVISGATNPDILDKFIWTLEDKNIDSLILLDAFSEWTIPQGETIDHIPREKEQREAFPTKESYTRDLFEGLAEKDINVYPILGYEDNYNLFKSILDTCSKEFPNIINTLENPVIKNGNHNLVFIHGEPDMYTNGENDAGTPLYGRKKNHGEHISLPAYTIERGEMDRITPDAFLDINEKIDTGFTREGDNNTGSLKNVPLIHEEDIYTNRPFRFHYTNLDQLDIKDPNKTVIISSIPPKTNFENGIDTKVDLSENGETMKMDELIETIENVSGSEFGTSQFWKAIESMGYNKDIRTIGCPEISRYINDKGINKLISSHNLIDIQKAHDSEGYIVNPREFNKSLFYNPGQSEFEKGGIFAIKGEKAGYINLDLSG
ncbi:MAG: hypothetical protein ACQEP1_04535 [Nanobdellota archaeon]